MNRGIFGFKRPGNIHPNPLALGQNSVARSRDSLAIGKNCTASGIHSTVIGNNNTGVALSNGDTASGNYSPPLGPILIGAFNYSTSASAGIISIGYFNNQTGASLSGTGRFSGVANAATTIGILSTTIGSGNTNSGNYSSAIGYFNTTSGISSNAFGSNNTASGNRSTSIGFTNIASGFGSTAAGYNNTAAGNYSSAIGYVNSMNSASLNCVLVGRSNFATSTSFATVCVGILNNQQSGTLNTSTGAISGTPAAATAGRLSTAIGILNSTSGLFSSALGYNNTSSGQSSLALGYHNTSSGTYSISAGYSNTASGVSSIALGNSSTSGGSNSIAAGYINSAAGAQSLAIGYKNSMNSASLNCVLVGRQNFATSTSFASISIGILNNQQSGTLNTTTGAITGTPAAAGTVGRLSTAVGISNTTSGNYSTAIGYSNTASGSNSLAAGDQCIASGTYTAAIGHSTGSSGNYGVALGVGASGSHNNTIVISCDSSGTASTATNQMVVGGITSVYFGNGVTNNAPNNIKISATSGFGSNVVGGSLTLASGVGTGNAVSVPLKLQTSALGGSTGSVAQTLVDRNIVGANKVIANNTTTTICNATVASNTVAAGIIRYCVEVFDGTDLVSEIGCITYSVSNKAGSIANNVISSKYGDQQTFTGVATLIVTWTITAANPALIQLNANANITPAAGYPRVTYEIINLTQQTIAPQ